MPPNRSIQILHLEDSARDAELIQGELAAGGLMCDVVHVDTEQRFEAALAGAVFDLIMVDYNLVGYDGRAALELARGSQPNVPVIFVSGSLGEEAAIDSLHLGATDYVLKQRLARLVPAVQRALAEAAERRRRRLAEADLRETAAQLERAQSVARLGSWTYDVAHGQFTCSTEALRIYGITAQALVPFENFPSLVHPDDRKYVDRSWAAALEGQRAYDLVYRILDGDSEKCVHERAELTRDDAGRVVRVLGMVQDVTERERDRNALVASEHFLRATLSALSDPIVVLDGDGRILKTNRAWREFAWPSGLPTAHVNEEVDYLGVCDRAAAEGIEEAAAAAGLIRELISGQRVEGGFEYASPSPEKEERWFLCRASRFQSDDQTRVVVTHTNITARMQAEEALRKLNAQLEQIVVVRTADLKLTNAKLASKEEEVRSVVDNLLSCVISINEKGTILSANLAVETVFGYSVDEVIGQNVSLLFPDQHRAVEDGEIDDNRHTGQSRIIGISGETEGLHKDGSRIPLDLNVNEYVVGGNRLYTVISRDDRERSRMLSELKHARDQAELANRAKSEFLAAMSHEIRTPMNGVIGMIDVLHQTSLKGSQVEMVELIRESAYSLLDIINDILDYSKIEAGRLEIERIPLRIEQIVERVSVILDRIAQKDGVELSLFVDPDIPVEVLGDPNRLRQVLVNLLSNAIKFSGKQGHRAQVSIRALLTASSEQGIEVEFRVSDNGIGMDGATMSRLFSPFTQADASTTRRFGGSGLGLAISHDLVSLMGGTISVQSSVGHGSTFSVRLPFAPSAAAAANGASHVAGLSCVVVGGPGGSADDFAAYLARADARVYRTSDLENARERAAEYPPGVVVWVIDTGETRTSADELRTRLRSGPNRDDRFVIVAIERGQRRRARRIAADAVMVDGNILRRESLLAAIATAAGREITASEHDSEAEDAEKVVPVSRDEALRRGQLILVVEDNEVNQKVILAQLHALGFAADIASNGRDALQRCGHCAYALVLTDLHMPEIDGYELTKAIRERESGSGRVPIVALTANALKGEADRCREVGMDDYLGKPVPLEDLRAVLEHWLPARSSNGQSEDAADGAPAPQSPLVPPVEVDALRALIGDNEGAIREVLRDFSARSANVVAELRAACTAGEGAAARAAAHKLKSSARAIGAFALGELCAEMEDAAGARDVAALVAMLPRFDQEFERVDRCLSSL